MEPYEVKLLKEYRAERRAGCGPIRAAFRAIAFYTSAYVSPKQICNHCLVYYWTLTPWRSWVCRHPNCVMAYANGTEGQWTIGL